MKITFLGTGAADWNYERHGDMPEYRRNSSLLIDECFLVDPSPTVPEALTRFGIDPGKLKYIINSHDHYDHFNAATVEYLSGAKLYSLAVGDVVKIGSYTVQVLPANHATATDSKHFIISDGKRRIFYGLDGAWLLYDEVEAIKRERIDLAVIDATIGDVIGDYRIFEHNNLNMVCQIKASLEAYVVRWFICHMARTLHSSHAELCERMKPHGIEVARDGLEIIV